LPEIPPQLAAILVPVRHRDSTAKQRVQLGLRRPRLRLRVALCRILSHQARFGIDESSDARLKPRVCPAAGPDAREDVLQVGLDLRRALLDEALHGFIDEPVQGLLQNFAEQDEALLKLGIEPEGGRFAKRRGRAGGWHGSHLAYRQNGVNL
jgi:hypothetical protein